jgi:hypothetical protein
MWMACETQQTIADAIGYSQQAVASCLNFTDFTTNGTDSVSGEPDENPPSAEALIPRALPPGGPGVPLDCCLQDRACGGDV